MIDEMKTIDKMEFWYSTNIVPVPRYTLLNILIDFYFALQERQDCPKCYSYGVNISLDANIEPEGCGCRHAARVILDLNEEAMSPIIDEYLWRSGLDPNEMAKRTKDFVEPLLEKLRKEVEDEQETQES